MADPRNPQKPIDPKEFLLPKTDPGFSAQAIGGVAPEAQRENTTRDSVEIINESPTVAQTPESKDAQRESRDAQTPVDLDAAIAETPALPPTPRTQPGVTSTIANSILRPLRTYRGDVEETMKETRASVVSIAAAEEKRRAALGARVLETPKKSRWGIIALTASILLVLAGTAVLVVLFTKNSAQQSAQVQPPAFIYVDQADETDATLANRTKLMTGLVVARNETALSLGLMRQLYFTIQTGTTTRALLPAPQFLATIAPNIPNALTRTLQSPFMLGIHVFEGNQPFLILKTDSYEQSFAGMIAWESTMQDELAPLFTRTPRPPTPGQGQVEAPIQFLPSKFVDRIVDNRDARVIEDSYGNITLLWTFLDRSTILITTNEYTLREVVSRIKNAPILPTPGR